MLQKFFGGTLLAMVVGCSSTNYDSIMHDPELFREGQRAVLQEKLDDCLADVPRITVSARVWYTPKTDLQPTFHGIPTLFLEEIETNNADWNEQIQAVDLRMDGWTQADRALIGSGPPTHHEEFYDTISAFHGQRVRIHGQLLNGCGKFLFHSLHEDRKPTLTLSDCNNWELCGEPTVLLTNDR